MDFVQNIISVVFILMLQDLIKCQRDVGDLCTFKDTGKPGKCKLLPNCQKAIELLQQKQQYPQTCAFKGTVPIVCCEESEIATTSSTITTESVILKLPNTNIIGAKSKLKCNEYSKYVYEKVTPVTLSGESETYLKNECKMVSQGLIVGGEEAVPREFPHMALIGYGSSPTEKVWLCGGSLISEQFVLTAGHCLYNREYGEAKYVRLGDLNIASDDDDARPQEIDITEQVPYPDYNPPRRYNDLALLRLARAATLNSYIRPACLHLTREVKSNNSQPVKPVATGWGRTDFFGDGSNRLLKVTLELFTYEFCNNTYKNQIDRRLPNGIIDKTQLCAGSPTQRKDTCQGDSGGPLQSYNTEEYCMYDIIGVTSFGKSCGVVNVPGVYTRVSNYIEWIESVVWP